MLLVTEKLSAVNVQKCNGFAFWMLPRLYYVVQIVPFLSFLNLIRSWKTKDSLRIAHRLLDLSLLTRISSGRHLKTSRIMMDLFWQARDLFRPFRKWLKYIKVLKSFRKNFVLPLCVEKDTHWKRYALKVFY